MEKAIAWLDDLGVRLYLGTRVAGGADPLIYRGIVWFVTGELP